MITSGTTQRRTKRSATISGLPLDSFMQTPTKVGWIDGRIPAGERS